jgi:monoamine oxidase
VAEVAQVASERYDDGNSHVPDGVTGSVERVIVVGAGISGLTAAQALHRAGVECVVLEARDRIGGRLHTMEVAQAPVDMGGSWIHTPIGNPLRRFAAQAGIQCTPGNPLPSLAIYDAVEERLLAPDEVKAAATLQFDDFPDAVEHLRDRLGPHATSAEGIEAFLVAAGLTGAETRRVRQLLRALIEADAAHRPEDQALRWLWTELEYGGDFFGDLPVGGYRTVVSAMAAGLDVRLGEPVVEVALGPDDVAVRTGEGTLRASHVVVAVPLGCLKRGVPTFVPPLPTARQETIERVGFGRYEKVIVAFGSPFWRAAGVSHLVHLPADPQRTALWTFDLDAFGAGPVLACHVHHTDAGQLPGSVERVVREVRATLSAAVGAPCPEPVAVHATSWAEDPWSGGAYSHLPPESEPTDLDRLGEPVGGRLLFAGEHTQSARVGYADGAMSSGIREAKRLLRRPDVELG